MVAMKLFVVGIILATVAMVAAVPVSAEWSLFRDFVMEHNKMYHTDAELKQRYAIFTANLKLAAEIQAQDPEATYGITEFMDLTAEEFASTRLSTPVEADPEDLAKSCLQEGVWSPPRSTNDLPESFDWREKGAVTAVKNQGGCGSCWAFSTTANIESQYFLKTGELVDFSPQDLVDCSKDCSNVEVHGKNQTVCNAGCMGGWQWSAYLSIMKMGGLEKTSDYPYTGRDGQCSFQKASAAVQVANYTCISSDEEQIAATLVETGPLAIAMNAGWLQFYKFGISNPPLCNANHLNHALLLVGYGVEKSKPYWIVKNSWGERWGDKGYFKIIRGKSKCGVNNAVSSAILA